MINFTDEVPAAKVVSRRGNPIPRRGVEGCICQEKAPADAFLMLIDRHGVIQWYARKSCPIHGISIKEDPSGSPASATSSETSTPVS